MKEDFLHYVWQYKQFAHNTLQTNSGETLSIKQFGTLNHDAGPDFSYAEIEIQGIRHIGHIEMHVNSAQWNQHKHQNDSQYNNVILHVVWEHNTEVKTQSGYQLPSLSLKGLVKRHVFDNYQQLMSNKLWIPCANQIKLVSKDKIDLWAYSIVAQRLEMKSQAIESLLIQNKSDYEKTLFALISKALGPNVNQDAFLELSQRVQLNQLLKIKDDLPMIEAYLFGVSGLLPESSDEDYVLQLKKDFEFLQNKYELVPLNRSMWKFSRMRPQGFPTMLIALLAGMVKHTFPLFSRILSEPVAIIMNDLKKIEASSYWDNHYRFGTPSPNNQKKQMSDLRIHLLIINAFVPLIYIYAKERDDQELIESTIDKLKSLPAEKNSIIQKWLDLGLNITDAKGSQAFLHLKKHYCNQFRCTQCMIGHQILNIETKSTS